MEDGDVRLDDDDIEEPKNHDPIEEEISRESAASSRDSNALAAKWWERARPKRKGAIRPAPAGSELEFHPLFKKWLEARGLSNALEQEDDQEGFFVYRFVKKELTSEQQTWERAFHGTRWYALWSILVAGVLLSSDDTESGHDFWEPGVCTAHQN